MTNLNTFLNKIDVFDDTSSCLVDADFVKKILQAMDKLHQCSKAKSFKDIIKDVNEVISLLDVDTVNNGIIVPLYDWNDVKENIERFIPYSSSLEEAEKFKDFVKEMR